MYEDYHMKGNVPKRVYADFECINQPTNNPNVLFKHNLIAVGFYLTSLPGSLCVTPSGNKYYSYFVEGCTGGQQSCVEWFVDEMLPLEKNASNLELEITPEEEESFQQSAIREALSVCWLCEQPFTEGKVRDHDHLTGKYRGAAHNISNINCKQKSSKCVFSITFWV